MCPCVCVCACVCVCVRACVCTYVCPTFSHLQRQASCSLKQQAAPPIPFLFLPLCYMPQVPCATPCARACVCACARERTPPSHPPHWRLDGRVPRAIPSSWKPPSPRPEGSSDREKPSSNRPTAGGLARQANNLIPSGLAP